MSANRSPLPQRAFTLIELLVVIAIIGLLASIILAALSNARGGASLAAGRQFASSLDNSLGSQAVGWWDFDEGSGSTLIDKSGYGNTGALVSGTVTWSTNTPLGGGASLTFCVTTCPNSTASAYVSVPDSSSLDLTGPSSFTVAFWLYPNNVSIAGIGANDNVIEKSNGTGWGIYVDNSNNLKIRLSATNGGDYAMNNSFSTNFSIGIWKQATVVLDRSKNLISWYLNGALVNTIALSAALGDLTNPATLNIGAGASGYGIDRFAGSIDGVRIFSSALTASQVGKLYAEDSTRFTPPVATR